jgi:hypothetical protein
MPSKERKDRKTVRALGTGGARRAGEAKIDRNKRNQAALEAAKLAVRRAAQTTDSNN